LRKFIRKILKSINKEGSLKNQIDASKYNSDKIYKMIKKYKVPYNSLNKDSVLAMINNFEKNSKNSKFDTNLLRTKTRRKSSLYTEKIKQRTTKPKEPSNLRRSTRVVQRKVIEYDEEPEIKSKFN
jgi:hypothetical protein